MEAVYKGIDWDGVSMTFGLDAVITATVVACALVTNDLVVRHELLGSSAATGRLLEHQKPIFLKGCELTFRREHAWVRRTRGSSSLSFPTLNVRCARASIKTSKLCKPGIPLS
jgi:hypothetical protein